MDEVSLALPDDDEGVVKLRQTEAGISTWRKRLEGEEAELKTHIAFLKNLIATARVSAE
ncbi:MAG: hypothetical protein V4719_29075 [Planctomycetota bacterium]